MKDLFVATISAVALLGLSPVCRAQDCSNWSNYDLRGTYVHSGSGWIDFSKLVPSLPSGTVPMAWVGAGSYNGRGSGTGWVLINAGGMQMSVAFVNMTYDLKPDCSVVHSYSMRVKELGITLGPLSRVSVIAGSGYALELVGITVGAGPGMPMDLSHSRRISMEFK